MKKATAFLTFVGLLAMLGGGLYVVKFHPTPEMFEPLLKTLGELVQESYRSPAMIGLVIFWLAAFLTSLMVLFESAPKEEKKQQVEEPKAVEIPEEKNEPKEEMVLKTDLDASIQACEEAEQKISQYETEVLALKSQLEKFVQTEDDKEQKAKIEAEMARLKQEIEELRSSAAASQKAAAEGDAQLKKLSIEIDAMTAKVEKTQEDIKKTRKESEKANAELNSAKADAQKNVEELAVLKEENEKIKADLQSAVADSKSGKHGIPPAAYQILYLFQKEGRLIDLLMEDVTEFDDETLGGAIRPIHEGCRKLLKERLIIEHVLDEEEGSEITLDEVDPEAIKLSGNVPSKGPYTGELVHRGWRLKECHLPELVDGWTGNVVAPAEIEIN